MPITPLQMLLAVVLPGAVALVLLLLTPRLSKRFGEPLAALAWALSLGGGMLVYFQQIVGRWPWVEPYESMSYAVMMVVPAAMVVAVLGSFDRVPRWVAWTARAVIAVGAFRVIMQSQYGGDFPTWSPGESVVRLDVMRVGLALAWVLLMPLTTSEAGKQGGGVWGRTGTGVLAMVLGFGAMVVFMSDSLRIGMFGLTATAVFVAGWLATLRRDESTGRQPAVDLFVVVGALLLGMGNVFGGVTVTNAALVASAPLGMWVVRLPWLRDRKPATLAAVRIVVVAVPLIIAAVLAAVAFKEAAAAEASGDVPWE